MPTPLSVAERRGGYPSRVRRWPRSRWAVALFIAVGVLVAMYLIVRSLGDDDVPDDTGTLPHRHVTRVAAVAS